MTGEIVQVSVSPGGIPKRPVASGLVTIVGIEGDSWRNRRFHGGPDQALLVMAVEVLDLLTAAGFPVFPGALGENLTVRGMPTSDWRAGAIFRAGTARIEFTKIRTPCSTLQVYGESIGSFLYDARVRAGDTGSPLWARSGFYARVLSPGVIAAGSIIELEAVLT